MFPFSPSTKSVQKQYVDKRIRHIHRSRDEERYETVQFVIRAAQRRFGRDAGRGARATWQGHRLPVLGVDDA